MKEVLTVLFKNKKNVVIPNAYLVMDSNDKQMKSEYVLSVDLNTHFYRKEKKSIASGKYKLIGSNELFKSILTKKEYDKLSTSIKSKYKEITEEQEVKIPVEEKVLLDLSKFTKYSHKFSNRLFILADESELEYAKKMKESYPYDSPEYNLLYSNGVFDFSRQKLNIKKFLSELSNFIESNNLSNIIYNNTNREVFASDWDDKISVNIYENEYKDKMRAVEIKKRNGQSYVNKRYRYIRDKGKGKGYEQKLTDDFITGDCRADIEANLDSFIKFILPNDWEKFEHKLGYLF